IPAAVAPVRTRLARPLPTRRLSPRPRRTPASAGLTSPSTGALLVSPLLDGVRALPAQRVQRLLVVHELCARFAPELELLRHEDRLLRARLLAEAAEDAPEHVDVEDRRPALDDIPGLELAGDDVDRLGRAHVLAERARHALRAALVVLHEDGRPAVVVLHLPPLLGVLHRHALP